MPLFSKTAWKLLSVLLENPLKEFKEIELITAAGTGKGAAANVLTALVKEGLLLERRMGKTKMISLHLRNPMAFWLKNLADQRKIQRLSKVRLATTLYFKEKASASLIILFGSTIAGTATPESDIDLLVVSQDLNKIDAARKKAEESLGQRLNLHLYTRKEIISNIKADAFVQNALIQGVILHGYDLASELYSLLQQKEKKTLERIYYFRERIVAAERNYRQGDQLAAREILSTLQEQLIFYILAEKGIMYASKKDAFRNFIQLPEGKVFKSRTKRSLQDKIKIIPPILEKMLIKTIVEKAGYGFANRD